MEKREGETTTVPPAKETVIPEKGDPVEGAPVEGAPVEGAPVEGAPVEGAPEKGAPDEDKGKGDAASTSSSIISQSSAAITSSTPVPEVGVAISSSTSPAESLSTSASAQPTETNSPPGLTTGQAVGIGFGSAIGGVFLLLAVGLVFLFIKRRDNGRKRRPQPAPPDSAALDLLEQPLAHETIRKDMRSLQTGIKNFVDNYFRFEKVILDAAGEAQIQALAGRPSQDSESSWSEALGDPSLQPLMTRAIISRALFAMIDPKYDGNITLLPPDLKGAYQSLGNTGPSSRRSIDVHQRTRLLSLWRRISGHLLSPAERPDQNQVEGVADEIAAVLSQLRPQKSGNYHAVLRNLVASAAKLGMNLFEQPHEWRALWSTSHSGKRGVAVFPGLSFITEVQPSDKGGGFEAVDSIRVCKVIIEE